MNKTNNCQYLWFSCPYILTTYLHLVIYYNFNQYLTNNRVDIRYANVYHIYYQACKHLKNKQLQEEKWIFLQKPIQVIILMTIEMGYKFLFVIHFHKSVVEFSTTEKATKSFNRTFKLSCSCQSFLNLLIISRLSLV